MEKKPNPIDIIKAINQANLCFNSEICKGILLTALSTNVSPPSVPLRFFKIINNLKKDKTLHFTKADKSSKLIIMDKVIIMYL